MINSRFLRKTTESNENKNDINITLEDFYSIRDFIYEKSGMYFADTKRDFIEVRVKKRVSDNNFESFKDYYYFLKYNTNDREFKMLMDAVTVNETKFFRNLPLLEVFEKKVLDNTIQNKIKTNSRQIRILSAGCSTGEEPYTLAMILDDNKTRLKNIDYRITAGDISEVALNSAKYGIYKDTQLRSTEQKYINKYFQKDINNNYKVEPMLRMKIDFTYLNLSDFKSMKMLGKFDIIFCRNVMIYFDNKFKKELVKTFYDMLNNNSYFFVGHSESLFGINSDFKMESINGIVVYKKGE